MGRWAEIQAKIDEHRGIFFDLVRIYLGIGLFVKGIQFSGDTEFLAEAVRQSRAPEFLFDAFDLFAAHYVVMAHVGGGLLLAVGLLTRVSCMFQIPVLAGAVALSFERQEGIFTRNQEFEFTALVLYLLILILIRGSGPLSVDAFLKKKPTVG